MSDRREVPAGSLSHGEKQWLEIGMLLIQDPKLVLLDEPVAGMTDADTEKSADLILRLKGQHTVFVVEHDMEFVEKLAGKTTGLHEGRVLKAASPRSAPILPWSTSIWVALRCCRSTTSIRPTAPRSPCAAFR